MAARCNISSTTGDFQALAIKAILASGGVGAALMRAIISSTLAKATAKPSSKCPRARAFFSSKTVRRVMTSRLWRKNASSICLRLSNLG